MRDLLMWAMLFWVCIADGQAAAEEADLTSQVLRMTGARTKIVWLHQMKGKEYSLGPRAPGEGGAYASEPIFEIMAFDTADGKTRALVPGPGFYASPKITRDGGRVIYSDLQDGTVYVLDWDGSNRKPVTKGFARCTWQNPADGSHWLYFSDNDSHTFRCRIDNPDVREVMWDKDTRSINSVAADGLHSSIIAWPQIGLAVLPNQSFRTLGTGCHECIAPDNSYRLFHMGGEADDRPEIGNHTGVVVYDGGGLNKHYVPYHIPGRERTPCWSARWTNDVRFIVLSCPWVSEEQEVYMGELAGDFNSFRKWIKITNLPNQDFFPDAWIDPGLGRFEGDAPFTAEFRPPAGGGEWDWEYGDGSKEKAPRGKHTWQKPGRYEVTARHGADTLKGSVLVRENRPPRITGVSFYDDDHIGLSFSEPVQLEHPSFSLSSAKVENCRLHPETPELILTLDGKLEQKDSLRVKGVFGASQAAPPLTDGRVKLVRPDWPASREGLVFLWETSRKPHFAYDPDSDLFRPLEIDRWRRAHALCDRWGAGSFDGGAMFAADGGLGIVARCAAANQFTLQATITPANIHQGRGNTPRRIIGCVRGDIEDVNLALAQEGDKLLLLLRHKAPADNDPAGRIARVELCSLANQVPNHVSVCYAPGKLACFLNGTLVKQAYDLKGSLPWGKPPFRWGMHFAGMPVPTEWWEAMAADVQPRGNLWHGKLEGVAIHSRALGADELAREYAAYSKIIARRKPVPSIEMEAKLAAKSGIPTAAEIAPYRDALVISEYDVVRVGRGKYKPKKIRVAQWGMLDGQPTALAGAKIGNTSVLTVERFADHPELEAEVQRDTLEPDHDLATYVDVTLRPSGEPRAARLVIHPAEMWLPPALGWQFSAEAFDQYGNPAASKVSWSVTGGGRINMGTLYSAGVLLDERDKAGSGSIDGNGLFTCKAPGVVTVTAASVDDPAVKSSGTVAISDYPAINPTRERSPLTFGDGFDGDIDRVRICSRLLTPEEIADHAAGKGLDQPDASLVGDWTFDNDDNGLLPEAKDKDLAARLVHLDDKKLLPLTENGRTFFRFDGRCHLEVAPNAKLDVFRTATLEAWIRTKAGGTIVRKQIVWALGFAFWANGEGLHADALRSGQNWYADGKTNVTNGEWVHVAAVLNTSGRWLLYANGELVGERKPTAVVTFP